MARFLAGFLSASLVWVGAAFAYVEGYLSLPFELAAPAAAAEEAEAEPEVAQKEPRRKRKRRHRRRKPSRRRARSGGIALTGDDLGGPGVRELNAAESGGEAQLTGHQIEQGFDSAMPRIRRCLILVAEDEPVTGKLVFGMRISGTGSVSKVNLRGPSAITRSEAGGCLRQAARSIDFPGFDGPDMVVHYPLTLQ